MEKKNINVDLKRCVECYTCQLACSFVHEGAFNPEKARIVIDPPNEISFTDECLPGCHICADYCAYDAIARK